MIKTFVVFFSKIDFFRKNVIIFVTMIHDVVCAMNLFRYLFKIFFASTKTSFFETMFDETFTTKMITITFRAMFSNLHFFDHYSNYFFRRDVVTKIKIVDFFDSSIQLLNR